LTACRRAHAGCEIMVRDQPHGLVSPIVILFRETSLFGGQQHLFHFHTRPPRSLSFSTVAHAAQVTTGPVEESDAAAEPVSLSPLPAPSFGNRYEFDIGGSFVLIRVFAIR
jgi:hypothetical protein